MSGMSLGILELNVDAAGDGLAEAFASSVRKPSGDFELDEVEIALEISADGKVGILGSGLTLRGGGSMKLKFVRRKQ
jgi:hypothetical protein